MTPPTKIYLQLDGDGGDEYEQECATWHDERVFDSDVEYVLTHPRERKRDSYETRREWYDGLCG